MASVSKWFSSNNNLAIQGFKKKQRMKPAGSIVAPAVPVLTGALSTACTVPTVCLYSTGSVL